MTILEEGTRSCELLNWNQLWGSSEMVALTHVSLFDDCTFIER